MSNKKFLTIILFFIIFFNLIFVDKKIYADEYNFISLNKVEGNYNTQFNSIEHTKDGGYIVSGFSSSTDGIFVNNQGEEDAIILKYTADNNLEWIKNFGDSNFDSFYNAKQTSDNGYIAVGYKGNIRDGIPDAIIVKYDNSGNVLWQSIFAGSGEETFNSVIEVENNNYIAVGETNSSDGDLSGISNQGEESIIVKYDNNGNVLWKKTFGGNNDDYYHSVIKDTNGDYIVVGDSNSTDGDLLNINKGNRFGTLVKYDKDGNVIFKKTFGGGDIENTSNMGMFSSISLNNDGSYIVSGMVSIVQSEQDFYGLTSNFSDAIIVKYDNNGNIIFKKTYGGANVEYFNNAIQTSDYGYICVGVTINKSDYIGFNLKYDDSLVVKFDKEGNLLWDKGYLNNNEDLSSVIESNGNFISSGSKQLIGENGYVSKSIGIISTFNSKSLSTPESTNNLTLNTTVEPTITLSTSTNSIDFGNISPLQDSYTQNMTVTVQSNNAYSLSLIANDDFKTADATPLVMSIDHLKVTTNGGVEQTVSKTTPVMLASSQPSTNSTIYNIGLKLNTDWNVKTGTYSTIITFKAQQ